jgi:hypothetical protein
MPRKPSYGAKATADCRILELMIPVSHLTQTWSQFYQTKSINFALAGENGLMFLVDVVPLNFNLKK